MGMPPAHSPAGCYVKATRPGRCPARVLGAASCIGLFFARVVRPSDSHAVTELRHGADSYGLSELGSPAGDSLGSAGLVAEDGPSPTEQPGSRPRVVRPQTGDPQTIWRLRHVKLSSRSGL